MVEKRRKDPKAERRLAELRALPRPREVHVRSRPRKMLTLLSIGVLFLGVAVACPWLVPARGARPLPFYLGSFGLLMFWLAWRAARSASAERQLLRNGDLCAGVVVELGPPSENAIAPRGAAVELFASYIVDGNTHSTSAVRSHDEVRAALKEGDTVFVAYDRERPSRATIYEA